MTKSLQEMTRQELSEAIEETAAKSSDAYDRGEDTTALNEQLDALIAEFDSRS